MRQRFLNIAILLLFVGTICGKSIAQESKREVIIADRVIAVIGERMILQSDLQMAEAYMKEQHRIPFSEEFSEEEKATLLNNMMAQKLLAAQAQLDSLDLPASQIQSNVDSRIEQIIESYGSIKAVEERYRKPMYMVRMELTEQLEEQGLAQMMTQDVYGRVKITPDEVKKIIKKIPKDSLPLIPDQYEYSHLVIKAPATEQTKNAVKEELLDLRVRVMEGANFAALATLYSDHDSAKKGGEMTVTPQMVVPAFADEMVSLPVGGISNIIETEEGFHIIQLLGKNGDKYNIRQILMRTKFSLSDLQVAMTKLDSIRTEILDENISFFEAVSQFSDDKDTKLTGGVVVNDIQAMYTGQVRLKTTKFFVDQLGADYQPLSGLKEGEISKPFQTYDDSGNLICKILVLTKKTPQHTADLKNDYSYLVDVATDIKTNEYFAKWLQKQKAKMYVRVEEPYSNYSLIKKEWDK